MNITFKLNRFKKKINNKILKLNLWLISVFLLLFIIISGIIYVFVVFEKNNKPYIDLSTLMKNKSHQIIFSKHAENISENIKKEILAFEDIISYDIKGSDIERINNSAGFLWSKHNSYIIKILQKCKDVSIYSFGAFDITDLPLTKMFKFNEGNIFQENNQILNILKNVDYNSLIIDDKNDRVKLECNFNEISLDSIALGAACEKIIDIYINSGINNGLVTIGGVTGVFGKCSDGNPWKIAIKNSYSNSEDECVAVFEVLKADPRLLISTFGIKNDKIQINEDIVNKVFDPKTGKISKNNISTVSVFYTDGVIACAISKLCAILPLDKCLNILNHYGAEAILIDNNKNILITPKLDDKITILNEEYKKEILDFDKS